MNPCLGEKSSAETLVTESDSFDIFASMQVTDEDFLELSFKEDLFDDSIAIESCQLNGAFIRDDVLSAKTNGQTQKTCENEVS